MFSKPNGDPMASTHSPTVRRAGSPILTVGRSFVSIFSTATSAALSMPRTFAVNSRRSVSFTFTSLAPSTTCALVRMMPSDVTMKPEPWPWVNIWPPPSGGMNRLKNG